MNQSTNTSFYISRSQKIGDGLMLVILLPLLYGFLFLIGIIIFELVLYPEQHPDTLRWMEHLFSVIGVVLLFRFFAMPWWEIECTNTHLILKNIQTKKVPLENIQLIHGGTEVGMQNEAKRSSAVPLTIERKRGGDLKIQLSPDDAQSCIDLVTSRCDWIGGMGTDGKVILPKDETAIKNTKRTLGGHFLFKGIVSLFFGFIAAVIVFSKGIAVVTDADNPIMSIVGILALISIIWYGFWSIGKYWKIKQMKSNTD